MPSLVLTLIGPDRPGLVDAVAALVTEHEGNWLESRMAHLAGQFAGIVRVDVVDAKSGQLIQALKNLDADGLTVTVRRDSSKADKDVQLVRLELVGNDRPGIVREVTRVLAQQQVNVEEFHTECVEAPNSGSTLFKATAQLRLPESLEVDVLQASLESIALDLMVDIRLQTDC